MKIDDVEELRTAMYLFRDGKEKEGWDIQDDFIAQLHTAQAEKQNLCPCTAGCKLHGKCMECVAIHRGHRDHLPYCFHSMLNDKLEAMSELAEHSLYERVK